MAYKQATIKLLLMQGENKAKLDNVKKQWLKKTRGKKKKKEKEWKGGNITETAARSSDDISVERYS